MDEMKTAMEVDSDKPTKKDPQQTTQQQQQEQTPPTSAPQSKQHQPPSQSLQKIHQQQQQSQAKQQQKQEPQSAEPLCRQPSAPSHIPNGSGEGRKISCEDIQLVQNLIERCLQLYMNQSEVITTLQYQAKIEPGFTSLVWQKLEEQNPDFFKAYYTRLKLKKQIVMFNHLLDQQHNLLRKMRMYPSPPLLTAMPAVPNGMHPQPMHHAPIGYPVAHQQAVAVPSGHHQIAPMSMPQSPPLVNGAASMQDAFPSPHGSPGPDGIVDMSMGLSPVLQSSGSGNLSSGNSDMSLGSMSPAPGSGGFPFGVSDMGAIGMVTSMSLDTPFPSSNDPTPPTLPISAADNDGPGTRESLEHLGAIPRNFSFSDLPTELTSADVKRSLGSLGQLPRNFSLSDLTADLTNSSDLVQNYTGSPYLAPDSFLSSPSKEIPDDDMPDALGNSLDLEFNELK